MPAKAKAKVQEKRWKSIEWYRAKCLKGSKMVSTLAPSPQDDKRNFDVAETWVRPCSNRKCLWCPVCRTCECECWCTDYKNEEPGVDELIARHRTLLPHRPDPRHGWGQVGRIFGVVAKNQQRSPGDLGAGGWAKIQEAFGHSCAYCGSSQERLVLEHVIPVALDGKTDRNNVVPACYTCNRRKGSKMLDQWLDKESFERFVERSIAATEKAGY